MMLLSLLVMYITSVEAQYSNCQTSLTNNDSSLLITCVLSVSTSTFRSCNIYWKKNNDVVRLPWTVQPQISSRSVRCELTVPVTHFGVGSHEMYGVFVSETGTQLRSESTTVTFSAPEVSLDSDCYIPWARVDNCLVGTQGYCTCSLKSPGFPPARISWVKTDGTSASQESSATSSKLLVTAPAQPLRVKNETFSCVWESALGKQTAQSFNVLYPAGPTSMTLRTLKVKETLDLCPGKANSITAVCEVPENAVFPSPWFHFTVNGTRPVYDWYAGTLVDGVYRYNQTVTLDRGGNFSVYCQPANNCTRTIPSPTKTLTVQVREPPRNAPVITINNKTYTGSSLAGATIKEGATVSVSCQVSGGVPPVRYVYLTCGDRTLSSAGTSLRLPTFVAKRSLNGQLCSCKANHVTGCYDKQTSVRLAISA